MAVCPSSTASRQVSSLIPVPYLRRSKLKDSEIRSPVSYAAAAYPAFPVPIIAAGRPVWEVALTHQICDVFKGFFSLRGCFFSLANFRL